MIYMCDLQINHPLLRLYRLISVVIFFWAFFFVIADTRFSASAAEMPEIQRRGYLNVAVKDNLPTLGFKDASGNLQGFEIDIAKALAVELLSQADAVRPQLGSSERSKPPFRLVPIANRDRLSVVLDNKVDLAIARVTATSSRARLVSFSVPYYLDGTVLITKKTTVQQLSDLARRKIAILNNSSTIAKVQYYLPNAELVGVDSYQEALNLLESNGAVAFAADASVLSGWVQQYPQYRLLPTKLSTEPLSVVMPKGLQYDELRRRVNEAIARYIASGWLLERAKYWGLP